MQDQRFKMMAVGDSTIFFLDWSLNHRRDIFSIPLRTIAAVPEAVLRSSVPMAERGQDFSTSSRKWAERYSVTRVANASSGASP